MIINKNLMIISKKTDVIGFCTESGNYRCCFLAETYPEIKTEFSFCSWKRTTWAMAIGIRKARRPCSSLICAVSQLLVASALSLCFLWHIDFLNCLAQIPSPKHPTQCINLSFKYVTYLTDSIYKIVLYVQKYTKHKYLVFSFHRI